jgi:predicted PhzF superfamily epimerase YddE/YHI9
MTLHITQVDAFTDRPFAGNPAAVCILPHAADDAWMQDVAREMNLAETAFLVRQRDGYDLRWFTPAVEVELCGHATLASAHVLWEDAHLAGKAQARFHTRSGLLTAQRRSGWIELDFPATPVTSAAVPPGAAAALGGAQPRGAGVTRLGYLVLELDDDSAVRRLAPNVDALARLDAKGVVVTGRSAAAEYDFVSRFFAPRMGVPEDPVTGSAHCALAPYWSAKLGKQEMIGFQASPRGGVVRVRLAGDRVHLGGQAVTVLRGELTAANIAS